MTRNLKTLCKLLTIAALYPATTGFVLLSSTTATLPVTPENPTITFVWNGTAPSTKEKGEYRDGAYQDLDDVEFMRQLLTDAMNIWNDVPGAFIVMALAEGDAELDVEDGQYSIVVEKSDQLSSAAFAKPYTEEETKSTISDCDISIADRSTEAKELAYTITHELGHCLGLGHAHTNYNAIMSYSRSRRDLSLGADDMAGLIYLYPDPAYVDGKPREIVCGSVGGELNGPWSAWTLLLIAMTPVGVAYWRVIGSFARSTVVSASAASWAGRGSGRRSRDSRS
jgi:hypothetical protein